MLKHIQNKIIAGVAIGLLITIILTGLSLTHIPDSWHLKIADTLYTKNSPSNDIIIIGIDDKSTRAAPQGLGRYTQWGRENYAKLLEQLIPENPAVIAFDIIYNNPSQNISIDEIASLKNTTKNSTNKEKLQKYEQFIQENGDKETFWADELFAEKIKEAGNVILAFAANEYNQAFPIEKFAANSSLGSVIAHPDEDGIMRRVATTYTHKETNKTYNSLALEIAEKFTEKRGSNTSASSNTPDDPGSTAEVPATSTPDDPGSTAETSPTAGASATADSNPTAENRPPPEILINYFSDPFGYKMVSFVDIMNGKFAPNTFKDKIVLIGIISFKEIQDKALTPRSNETPMPGVEVHANIVQTILTNDYLSPQSPLSKTITLALISISLTIALIHANIIVAIIITLLAIAAYLAAAHIAYENGLILNMVYPFLAIILAYLAAWVYRYFIADKKKREMTGAFSHYVSKELVDRISKNPDIVKLGGEKRVITVFFSDIVNSTGLSENVEIEDWVAQMNEYFTVMESVIKKHGGTLDKYEGDAIMGFWNAPVEQADHVELAYTAALEMRKVLGGLHKKWRAEGRPLLEFRIGINTGEAIVGNFGSENRFDYTVMGDTVNVASRLESYANKKYGTSMVVAGCDPSLPALGDAILLREIDEVVLPGKKDPVVIHELIGFKNEVNDDVKAMIGEYAKGLAAYRLKDFDKAMLIFEKNASIDMVSKIMMEQCGANAGKSD